MGNWSMHIEGHGIHDNGPDAPNDADAMLKEFAGKLRIAGHDVHAVSFTSGITKELPVSDTGSVESPPDAWRYRR